MTIDTAAFAALDPFFDVILRGLKGRVDEKHFWDIVAEDAVFEFLYNVPGWPRRLEGRAAIMKAFLGYGNALEPAAAPIVHSMLDPAIVLLEYEIEGTASTGRRYSNRFASVITIADRKIVHWRDYMDSLAVMAAVAPLDAPLGALLPDQAGA